MFSFRFVIESGGDLIKDKRIVLEMSLKPFTDDICEVCTTALQQWMPLIKDAKAVSVMLWIAEGSEILEWKGNPDETIEWAKYIGYMNDEDNNMGARVGNPVSGREYITNPPVFTYADIKNIVLMFKQVAMEKYNIALTMGTTFDLGPEFARSKFKYKIHPEITGAKLGGKTVFTARDCNVVCCWSKLKYDPVSFAGYPDGIPEGTSFGRYLGRQADSFMEYTGFDYIWFSNGFGFSYMPWSYLGVNFNGDTFNMALYEEVKENIISFWKDFKNECDYPVEVRGTNMGTGMDMAVDLIPVKKLYEEKLFRYPPPNSPWGALDNDFGLELSGYMSRIAKLPGEGFTFRYYINDPWYWQNPWWDYYDREPFDIYCPLSVGRINEKGEIETASVFNMITIDTEKGILNENCPLEVIPHLKRGVLTAPDKPGILTWLYPFDEFDRIIEKEQKKAGLLFFSDWFVRNAINSGLPLNTVVSTDIFFNLDTVLDTIILAPAFIEEDYYQDKILEYIERGGKVLFYGPVTGMKIRTLLNINVSDSIEGEFKLESAMKEDVYSCGKSSNLILHEGFISGGGLNEKINDISDKYTKVKTYAVKNMEKRVYALTRKHPGNEKIMTGWVRGTLPFDTKNALAHAVGLPKRQSDIYADSSILLRYILADFGYEFLQEKYSPETRSSMCFISRNDNAFIFSGVKYDTTVGLEFLFPEGAPIFTGKETLIKNGRSRYFPDRTIYSECRIFIEQSRDGVVSCKDVAPRPTALKYAKRRIRIKYLKNAKVTIYPPLEALKSGVVEVNNSESLPGSMYVGQDYLDISSNIHDNRVIIDNISGSLEVSW